MIDAENDQTLSGSANWKQGKVIFRIAFCQLLLDVAVDKLEGQRGRSEEQDLMPIAIEVLFYALIREVVVREMAHDTVHCIEGHCRSVELLDNRSAAQVALITDEDDHFEILDKISQGFGQMRPEHECVIFLQRHRWHESS